MKNFNSMPDDYNTSQSNLVSEQQAAASTGNGQPLAREPNRSSSSRQLVVDEMSQDLTYLSREAPLDGGESTFGAANSYSQLAGAAGRELEDSVLHMGSELPETGEQRSSSRQFSYSHQELEQLSPDNVDIQKPLQQAGFLVSFMVDARGGAMRGCRHSGVRVIIPPNSAQMPMRITCRYLRRERLVHPPPLMEGEACASKIMEVGPAGAKFLGPVLIEVPHFASLRGKEREIIILRSDSGEVWREHLVEADDRLVEQIIRSARSDPSDDQFSDQENRLPESEGEGGGGGGGGEKRRLTRIITNEFPQYFAIISRIRQEVHAVGPEGSTINSQVVPRVQAIFTEGALTKRIKIGLQGNKNKQAQETNSRPESPGTNQQDASLIVQEQLDSLDSSNNERATSPLSNQGSQTPRPGSSATNKRPRSRFLACFGAGHGSVDLLSATSESSTGGDSPRQPCNEKLVKQRHILGDVSDSEGELSSREDSAGRRVKRHAVELVPDDYYIEREQPLILNEEPKTYGKRLQSSSAQTDSKLNLNGYLSTSAKKSSAKKRRGLLPGKRKNKTQLNIVCSDTSAAADAAPADSSLDTLEQQNLEEQRRADEISLIKDVVTSDDHKWRTCTIQTDSDSVTVNYVMAASGADAATAPNSAQDDGYASGSGDLNRQSSFGKGLFGLGAFGSSDRGASDEVKRTAHQQRSKKAKKEKKEKVKKVLDTPVELKSEEVELESLRVKTESPEPRVAVDEKTDDEQQVSVAADASLVDDSTARSVSPSGKELKQKLKLEKREKDKREKEEKLKKKELEEAAAKAEKLKKKLDKEAKKAEKQLQKAAKKSPPASKPQTPVPGAESTAKTTSVKFASDLVEPSEMKQEPLSSLGSEMSELRLKDRSGSQDGVDSMVRLSISEKLVEQAPASLEQPVESRSVEADKLISFSESELDESLKTPAEATVQADLKPILKQQSTSSSGEEVSSELVIDEKRDLASVASKLVSEATEKAVREADRLSREAKQATESPEPSSASLSKKELDKLEKERLKKEAKAKAEEEKRLAKEAKQQAKEAELAKKAEEAEAKKAAKAAKAELERQAKETKAEQERLAKEAKSKAKLELKESKKASKSKVKDAVTSSAPPADESVVEEHSVSELTESKSTSLPATEQLEASATVLKTPEEVKVDAGAKSSTEDDSSKKETSSSSDDSKKKKKKKEKEKKPKEAKVKKEKMSETSSWSAKPTDQSEATDEATEPKSSASKSSLFGRLFKRKPKVDKTKDEAATEGSSVEPVQVEAKPMIMSEMYPSDPDDAESEMILEVNVPKNLIESKHHVTKRQLSFEQPPVAELSQASDGPTSPTLGTTIDESFATTDDHGVVPASEKWSSQQQQAVAGIEPDEQADETLVNVSQMVASDLDDDDATENVVSQTIELVQDTVSRTKRSSEEPVSAVKETSVSERVIVTEPQLVDASKELREEARAPTTEEPSSSAAAGEPKEKAKKKSKAELKKEKELKELEVKLQKEAKKRAEEEEKLKKKEEKEEKLRLKEEEKRAEKEAKRLAKEAKVKAKLEAQEAKRLAKLAGKEKKAVVSGVAKVEATQASEKELNEPSTSKSEAELAAEVEREERELANMTPVNTETEVQRIVEEVVGEDGVVTRTTRTVETKYVTLRQEEVRLGELRKMPLEEYERLVESEKSKAGEQQAAVNVDLIETEPQTERKLVNIVLRPYEHEELDKLRATPSYFDSSVRPVELEKAGELSPKKELKKRIKLNQRLIKRAHKLAKSEAKKAKRDARLASNEIAVCDESAKQARKELKRALKQAKKAAKLAAKQHKKMDKVDRKLAKRQSKIDKRQKKLDKLAAKTAAKEAKKRAKEAAKEAKRAGKLSKQSSGSRKSIKLEDIGEPVLQSGSRLSLAGQQASEMVTSMTTSSKTVIERASPVSGDDIQVEMSLEAPQELVHTTIIRETVVEHPDGQVEQQVSERRLSGEAALAHLAKSSAESEDEEIDVVSELPKIPSKREPELAD